MNKLILVALFVSAAFAANTLISSESLENAIGTNCKTEISYCTKDYSCNKALPCFMACGFSNTNPNCALTCMAGVTHNHAWWTLDSCVIGQMWGLELEAKDPVQSCQNDCETAGAICMEDNRCAHGAMCFHNCDHEDYVCQGDCQEKVADSNYWWNLKGCYISCLIENL